MKLTGPACTEALNGAEEAGRRERAEGSAGGVRVERRVRPILAISMDVYEIESVRLVAQGFELYY
jgi:hypothetical protein